MIYSTFDSIKRSWMYQCRVHNRKAILLALSLLEGKPKVIIHNEEIDRQDNLPDMLGWACGYWKYTRLLSYDDIPLTLTLKEDMTGVVLCFPAVECRQYRPFSPGIKAGAMVNDSYTRIKMDITHGSAVNFDPEYYSNHFYNKLSECAGRYKAKVRKAERVNKEYIKQISEQRNKIGESTACIDIFPEDDDNNNT